MSCCLLCLQPHIIYREYIPINSRQWFQLKIREKIEKHFWTIGGGQNILGICFLCWSNLNYFHAFHKTIENAHHRNIHISKEENSTNCLEMERLQINTPQIFKAELESTEESNLLMDVLDDIKSEEILDADESIVCVSTRITKDEMDIDAITEKRKRGRPKKHMDETFTKNAKDGIERKRNINKTLPNNRHAKRGRPKTVGNTIIKKPKGKRGRPRKYILDISDNHINTNSFQNDLSSTLSKIVNRDIILSKADSVHQPNYTHELETRQESGLDEAIGRSSSQKVKRSRGRPRKTQINNDAVHEPDEEVLNGMQCPPVQKNADEMDIDPISTKKRKRGRPKKHIDETFTKNAKDGIERNINKSLPNNRHAKRGRPNSIGNTIIKKPKGKRGRPSKYILDISDNNINTNSFQNDLSSTLSKIVDRDIILSNADSVHQPNYTHEQDTRQASGLDKAVGRGSSQKVKRSRGRPRKTQIMKNDHEPLIAVHELEVLKGMQCPPVQKDSDVNNAAINSEKAKKLIQKNNNFFSLMKKCKQRRALMRNYIATSVRCMKFLKSE